MFPPSKRPSKGQGEGQRPKQPSALRFSPSSSSSLHRPELCRFGYNHARAGMYDTMPPRSGQRRFEGRRTSLRKLIPLVLLCLAAPLMAGAGMWMPQQVPQLAAELQKLGIKIDPKSFADLTGDPMGAVVSLG